MQFDFTLTPGGGQQIDVVGQFVKLKSSYGMVRVTMDTGGYIDLTPGQGIRLQKPFTRLTVKDRSGAANAGILLAGAFEFQDDSIAGTVNVVDSSVSQTLASKCFLGMIQGGIAGTGNYGAHYLTNPDGNQKNVVVEALSLTSSAGNTMTMHALASGAVGAGSVSAQNKNVSNAGNAPSTAKIWKYEETPTSFLLLGAAFQRYTLAANVSRDIKLAEPIIIRPGVTLAVVAGTTVAQTIINLEFREEPI